MMSFVDCDDVLGKFVEGRGNFNYSFFYDLILLRIIYFIGGGVCEVCSGLISGLMIFASIVIGE